MNFGNYEPLPFLSSICGVHIRVQERSTSLTPETRRAPRNPGRRLLLHQKPGQHPEPLINSEAMSIIRIVTPNMGGKQLLDQRSAESSEVYPPIWVPQATAARRSERKWKPRKKIFIKK